MVYSEQENFWLSKFGDKYNNRNKSEILIRNKKIFFKKIFLNLKKNRIGSVIEFGANVGLNLLGLKKIFKLHKITGVEINKKASLELKKISNVNVFNGSIRDFIVKERYDLVLTCGFLIHLKPAYLRSVYKKIYDSCKNEGYILIAEYYNSSPISITYRGFKNKLFKRDFAGEFISLFKKTRIVDYGFAYHKDKHSQDDLTWFLIKKNSKAKFR